MPHFTSRQLCHGIYTEHMTIQLYSGAGIPQRILVLRGVRNVSHRLGG